MQEKDPSGSKNRLAQVSNKVTLPPKTPKELNERNASFYADRSRILQEQLTKETLEIALRQRESEARRGVPFQNWSFEGAVADAASALGTAKRGLARMGGSSKKRDALQKLIVEIVRKEPHITASQLLGQLKKMSLGGIIDCVEDESNLVVGEKPMIQFQDHHKKIGLAPISGLKDRLSRAKKRLSKEIAPTG